MESKLRLNDDVKKIRSEQSKKKDAIVEYYQSHLPYIEDYINWKNISPGPMRIIAQNIKKSNDLSTYKCCSDSMIDFRFHTGPVVKGALSISQTDNYTNNEIKYIIRNLIRKGWKFEDIVYELERIYGSGVIIDMNNFGYENKENRIFFRASIILLFGGIFMLIKLKQYIKRK